MTPEELRDLLILIINRNATVLRASVVDADNATVGIEDLDTGGWFTLEVEPCR